MGRKRKSTKSWLSVHWPILVIGTAAVALVSGILFWGSRATPSKPVTQAGAVPVFFNRAEDAGPLPATLEPANFTPADVREAYHQRLRVGLRVIKAHHGQFLFVIYIHF